SSTAHMERRVSHIRTHLSDVLQTFDVPYRNHAGGSVLQHTFPNCLAEDLGAFSRSTISL
ncbi:MAG: hypothetical protein AAFX02_04950, partial [Pseudomonadota bacterium]